MFPWWHFDQNKPYRTIHLIDRRSPFYKGPVFMAVVADNLTGDQGRSLQDAIPGIMYYDGWNGSFHDYRFNYEMTAIVATGRRPSACRKRLKKAISLMNDMIAKQKNDTSVIRFNARKSVRQGD